MGQYIKGNLMIDLYEYDSNGPYNINFEDALSDLNATISSATIEIHKFNTTTGLWDSTDLASDFGIGSIGIDVTGLIVSFTIDYPTVNTNGLYRTFFKLTLSDGSIESSPSVSIEVH